MLSSRLKKKRELPGSPCLPLRPRNFMDKNQHIKFKYLFDRVGVASIAARMKKSGKGYADVQVIPASLLTTQQGKGDKKKKT